MSQHSTYNRKARPEWVHFSNNIKVSFILWCTIFYIYSFPVRYQCSYHPVSHWDAYTFATNLVHIAALFENFGFEPCLPQQEYITSGQRKDEQKFLTVVLIETPNVPVQNVVKFQCDYRFLYWKTLMLLRLICWWKFCHHGVVSIYIYTIWRPSHLYNDNFYTKKDGLSIEMAPILF